MGLRSDLVTSDPNLTGDEEQRHFRCFLLFLVCLAVCIAKQSKAKAFSTSTSTLPFLTSSSSFIHMNHKSNRLATPTPKINWGFRLHIFIPSVKCPTTRK